MDDQNFQISFTVDQTPSVVYDAINNVRGWWSEEIEGVTDTLGEFRYHFKDVHKAIIHVEELIPGEKVVWHIVENYFKFTKDPTEWTGNDIIFDISEVDGKTKVTFTHVGLVPEYECFDICSNAWGTYITGSLKNLIETGKGEPNSKTQARTEKEKELSN